MSLTKENEDQYALEQITLKVTFVNYTFYFWKGVSLNLQLSILSGF